MSSGCAHVHAAPRATRPRLPSCRRDESPVSPVARSGRLPWDTSSVRLPWHTSSLPWHTSSREGRGGARQEMNLLLLHRRVPSGCGSPTWLALPRHELRTPSYTGRRLGGRGGRGTNLWGAFGSWTFVMFARKPVSSIDHQPARPAAAGMIGGAKRGRESAVHAHRDLRRSGPVTMVGPRGIPRSAPPSYEHVRRTKAA